MKRGVASQQANVDLEIKSDILATVVKRCDGSADLVETFLQVLLLP